MPCSLDLPNTSPDNPICSPPQTIQAITGRSVLTTFCPAAYSAEYGIGVPIECAARQCTTYGDRCWRARSERVTADVREHSFWVRSLGGHS